MNGISFYRNAIFLSLIAVIFSAGICRSEGRKIYIINYAWHTGIVVPIDPLAVKHIPTLEDFKSYRYADIGWGDEDFYQHEDFNFFLAAKALLLPTSSAIRIEGYNMSIEKAARYFERCCALEIDSVNYIKLLEYINSGFRRGSNGKEKKLSVKQNGRIIYYGAGGAYYFYNTCNTWTAEGLSAAGLEVDAAGVVTAEDMFESIKSYCR